MDFSDVTPPEITFKHDFSVVFLVDVRNKLCVMKVHRNDGLVEPAPLGREIDIHICESTAYKRLKEHGLCDREIIPQYYGSLENIDAQHFLPHLETFLNDKHAPSAIFLEYIPRMRNILPQLYTERRMQNFISGIREIHKALVLHCNVNLRNMMIVENDPERAVWMDFDRAQTYHADSLSQRQKGLIEMEEMDVCQFAEKLASNCCGFDALGSDSVWVIGR